MNILAYTRKNRLSLYYSGWVLLIAYLLYLIFQFQTYAWWVIKWHSHLALPVLLFWIWAGLLLGFQKISKRNILPLLQKGFYLMWLLMVLEIIWMVLGIGKKLGDESWGRYQGTNLVPTNTSAFHTWTPGIKVNIKKQEFTYIRTINSLGLADNEWSIKKDSNKFRVLCLGDSFTEGDAVNFEESYVAQLRKIWQQHGLKKVEILNGGLCGSDPFYNYYHYKNRLHIFQPDFIIQTISSHDIINDIAERGGLERFTHQKGIYRKPFKPWQVFYVSNYSFRIVMYSFKKISCSISNMLSDSPLEKLNGEIAALLTDFYNETKVEKTDLFIVFLPGAEEVKHKRYYHDMEPIKASLRNQGVPFIDLLPCYLHESKGGEMIDEYYWKIDRHHNAKGYEMMAECIYKGLQTSGLLKEQQTITHPSNARHITP